MTFSPVTIDAICLGLFGFSGMIGIFRGFTKELLSLFTWLLSIGLTYIFHDHFIHIALSYIKNPFIAKSIVSSVMFITLYIVFNIIVYLIVSLIKDSILSGLDRTLGFFYGFLRGYIILVLVHQSACLFFSNKIFPDEFKGSFFYEYIENGSIYLNQALPDQVKAYFDRNEHSLKPLDIDKHLSANKVASPVQQLSNGLFNTQKNVNSILSNMNTNIEEVEKFAKLKPKIDTEELEKISGTSKEQQKALGKFFAASKDTEVESEENIDEKIEHPTQPQTPKQSPKTTEIEDALDRLF